MKKTNESTNIDRCCRKIKMRYVFHFLQKGGSVTESVADIHHRFSPKPVDGLEILMYFVYRKKAIIEKMENFVEKQLDLITQPFEFNQESIADGKEKIEKKKWSQTLK